ncbi:prepilin peptidase [Candidatus Gracilibacteria bacterium]|nr:prepilin peptidase [Candidatus Gracilibacteria bacterium]
MILFSYFLILFILGSIFGSFSTVLIERWHSGKGGIMTGRSECPNCKKILTFFELFPILSYLVQGGKCAGCKKHISVFYPIVEFFMGMIFIIVGYGLYKYGFTYEDPELWLSLFFGWVTGIYIIYDIKYREIPDQIIVPGIYTALTLLILGYFYEGMQIFFDIPTYNIYDTYHTFMYDHISGAIILYSFFYIQILIPGGFYLLKIKDIKNFLSLLLSYFTLPLSMFVELFKRDKDTENEVEIPTWIGGGDLRVALFIGLTLGSSLGIIAFAIAYVTGSIVGLILIFLARSGKIARQKEIAFGPFLGLGWLTVMLFHSELVNIISKYILI